MPLAPKRKASATRQPEISTRPRPKEMVREGMGCSMAVKKPEITTLKPTKRKAKEYSRRADTEEANRALSGWRNRPTTAPASTWHRTKKPAAKQAARRMP